MEEGLASGPCARTSRHPCGPTTCTTTPKPSQQAGPGAPPLGPPPADPGPLWRRSNQNQPD
eukprot:1093912-Lingulodinium_polyedra.AAC.1